MDNKEILDWAIKIGIVKYFNKINSQLNFLGCCEKTKDLISIVRNIMLGIKELMIEEEISSDDPDLIHILSIIKKEKLND